MISGFIFLHVSFLYYFPLSKEVKALVIFSLGIFYFLVPLRGSSLLYFTEILDEIFESKYIDTKSFGTDSEDKKINETAFGSDF